EGLLPRFLLYFLLQPSLREDAVSQMTGAVGHKRVPSNYLLRREFLLPPTTEQERIVEKLDAALSGLERAETAARRAKDRLKLYQPAALKSAINGKFTAAWRETRQKSKTADKESGEDLLQRLLIARRVRWEEVELNRLQAAGGEPKSNRWKS